MIEPNLHSILDGGFDQLPLYTIAGFETHMGLQLEMLFLQNRHLLIQKLGILPVDVVRSGPYRHTKTTTQQGSQIDYLFSNLNLKEMKLAVILLKKCKRRYLD